MFLFDQKDSVTRHGETIELPVTAFANLDFSGIDSGTGFRERNLLRRARLRTMKNVQLNTCAGNGRLVPRFKTQCDGVLVSQIARVVDLKIGTPAKLVARTAQCFFLVPTQGFFIITGNDGVRLILSRQRDRDGPDDCLDNKEHQNKSRPDELGGFFLTLELSCFVHCYFLNFAEGVRYT